MSERTSAEGNFETRLRRWWVRPLWMSLAVVYLPQAIPFFLGPMMESRSALDFYLKYFLLIPGALFGWTVGRKLPFDLPGNSDGWAILGLGGLITVSVIFAVVMIGGSLKGWKRWLFFLLIVLFSGFNSLVFSALLRAG